MRLTLVPHRRDPELAGSSGSRPPEGPDDHHDPIHRLAAIQPTIIDAERLALAGFLVGYRGPTYEAYTLNLRQFTG